MKIRNDIYSELATEILNVVSLYKVLKREQILTLFTKDKTKTRNIINAFIKDGRIFYEPKTDVIMANEGLEINNELIITFWILIDFKDKIVYHTPAEFPIQSVFITKEGECYEVVYVPDGKETMISSIFKNIGTTDAKRIICIDDLSTAKKIQIPETACYCKVLEDGKTKYFGLQKG